MTTLFCSRPSLEHALSTFLLIFFFLYIYLKKSTIPAGDFAVEVVLLCISTISKISTCLQVLPALDSLPPLVTSGYGRSEVNKAALSHDCFHYNGRTQGMVLGSEVARFIILRNI